MLAARNKGEGRQADRARKKVCGGVAWHSDHYGDDYDSLFKSDREDYMQLKNLPTMQDGLPKEDPHRLLALGVIRRAIADRLFPPKLMNGQYTLADAASAREAIDDGEIAPWLVMAGLDPSWALPLLQELVKNPRAIGAYRALFEME